MVDEKNICIISFIPNIVKQWGCSLNIDSNSDNVMSAIFNRPFDSTYR